MHETINSISFTYLSKINNINLIIESVMLLIFIVLSFVVYYRKLKYEKFLIYHFIYLIGLLTTNSIISIVVHCDFIGNTTQHLLLPLFFNGILLLFSFSKKLLAYIKTSQFTNE